MRPFLVVSVPSSIEHLLSKKKQTLLLVQNEERMRKKRSFDQEPSVDTDDIQDLPPSFLHTASDQKLDGGKAWELI